MKRLMMLLFLAMGIWAGNQYVGLAAEGSSGTLISQATGATSAASKPPAPPDAYTQAMLIGYAAEQQGDYQTALINFRRALAERPNDKYARAAVRNMETYIARQRAEAARLEQIANLQVQLSNAVAQRDWACAAATVDHLTLYFPETSLDRAKLVAYRGEITGFLAERTDIENWSTVCPGTI